MIVQYVYILSTFKGILICVLVPSLDACYNGRQRGSIFRESGVRQQAT